MRCLIRNLLIRQIKIGVLRSNLSERIVDISVLRGSLKELVDGVKLSKDAVPLHVFDEEILLFAGT